jgi:hypothetical protein
MHIYGKRIIHVSACVRLWLHCLIFLTSSFLLNSNFC